MTCAVSVGLCFPFFMSTHISAASVLDSSNSKIRSSYFVSKDEVLKVAVRNVLQENSIMAFFENHRIQLDNVVVVQYVRLCLICQLSRSSAKINE